MWLATYTCSNPECPFTESELFFSKEEAPDILLGYSCPLCKSALKRFDFKNNSQRWKFRDEE